MLLRSLSRSSRSFASIRVPLLVLAAVIPLALGIAQPPAAPTHEPTPDELIKDLEKKTQPTPAPAAPPTPITDTTTLTDAATTGTRLLREGTFVTSRRGRMTRSTTNEWVFSFDADARAGGGAGRSDPAMVMLPCMNLQNMERVVERSGDGVTFTLSGQVFVYKSRNYLLPTMYVVNRRADIAPAQ